MNFVNMLSSLPSSSNGSIPGLWWGPRWASLYCVFILIVFVLCVPMLFGFPWIVHSWLPSTVVSIVYLSVMDIHIFLFFIAKHVYSWEASQNVFSRIVINRWITYFYLCFISFKIFFFSIIIIFPFALTQEEFQDTKGVIRIR